MPLLSGADRGIPACQVSTLEIACTRLQQRFDNLIVAAASPLALDGSRVANRGTRGEKKNIRIHAPRFSSSVRQLGAATERVGESARASPACIRRGFRRPPPASPQAPCQPRARLQSGRCRGRKASAKRRVRGGRVAHASCNATAGAPGSWRCRPRRGQRT